MLRLLALSGLLAIIGIISPLGAQPVQAIEHELVPITPVGKTLTAPALAEFTRYARQRWNISNKRLNTAHVLKESFGQLWDYRREAWARRFFDNWRASLRWQRLESYQKFAAMIDRHWDGIAACCKPENKVSLGFLEGLNTKIRVVSRRAYGLRDEDYLRLKSLTCMLPEL